MRSDDREPELPIGFEPASNDEFVAPPPTAMVVEAVRRARQACEDNARRVGLSRRDFLLSTMGAATCLQVLAACAREERSASPATTGTVGTFTVPATAGTDRGEAAERLGGKAAILDVQGHLLEPDQRLPYRRGSFFGEAFPQAACSPNDPRDCFTIDRFLGHVFGGSDTAAVVVSAIPIAPDETSPLSTAVRARAIERAKALGCNGRVLVQGHCYPTAGPLPAALDAMSATKAVLPGLVAWKVYTHGPGKPWRLDDAIGTAFLQRVRELGPRVVAIHKGFGADPADVGPAAAANPDITFVIYHSGYEAGVVEGRFAAARPNAGADRLLLSLRRSGIGVGANVYAELGTTWRSLMGAPDQAAHLLGKLLVALGEDRMLWGTDSIWYGSPQDQIEAFRTFEISAEAQDRFGYPALTPARKAKIFGANAARLHGIDLAALAATCKP